ncbi:MAG: efflux RND transporter periplasmic adaptor subunit [Thiotrichales bacterium]
MRKIIALIGALGLAPSTWANVELPFATATVVREVVAQERILDGTVEAVNQTTVSAQTSGQVTEIAYDVDDFVKKDTVIVKLKAAKQEAGAAEARAALAEAEARLKQAEQEFARISEIYEKKLVAKSQLDAATAELNSAKARVQSARASIAKADEQLGQTLVRAPYSGIVTERHIELGEFVNVGHKLMTGISLEKLRVQVEVPQNLINPIRELKKARVLTGDGAAVPVESLTFFPYADPNTNTFKVRVNLAKDGEGLFPGMFAKVAFTTGEQSQLVVPSRAVAYRSEVTGIYVLNEDGQIRFRQIRLGHKTADNKAVVLAGLQEGEAIALDPIAAGIHLKRQVTGTGEAR